MKATELMIGDYVSVEPSGQRICIAAIHNGKVGYHSVAHRLEWVRIGLLRPIPLTAEILEKNGWKWHVADAKFFSETWVGSLLLRKQGEAFRILAVSDYDDEDTNNTPFTIRYVHELQQLLRIGGIEKEVEL